MIFLLIFFLSISNLWRFEKNHIWRKRWSRISEYRNIRSRVLKFVIFMNCVNFTNKLNNNVMYANEKAMDGNYCFSLALSFYLSLFSLFLSLYISVCSVVGDTISSMMMMMNFFCVVESLHSVWFHCRTLSSIHERRDSCVCYRS